MGTTAYEKRCIAISSFRSGIPTSACSVRFGSPARLFPRRHQTRSNSHNCMKTDGKARTDLSFAGVRQRIFQGNAPSYSGLCADCTGCSSCAVVCPGHSPIMRPIATRASATGIDARLERKTREREATQPFPGSPSRITAPNDSSCSSFPSGLRGDAAKHPTCKPLTTVRRADGNSQRHRMPRYGEPTIRATPTR